MNVLLTGSSGGIGKAIRAMLEGQGHFVIGVSRQPDGSQRHISVDLADQKGPKCAFDTAVVGCSGGYIDVLINNAGACVWSEFDSLSADEVLCEWTRMFAVNLLSSVRLTHEFIKFVLERRGRGRIINVGSRAAFRGGATEMAYASMKSGLVNFTRSLAVAYATKNISAHSVSPGWTDTNMAHASGESMEAMASGFPIGRIICVDAVVEPIAFFVNCRNPMDMTGANIDVNGGSYFH